jgi:hypothetical protein
MSIKFQATQHFFLFEKRPANKLKGKVTSHPFACVAIGFEPSEPELPFRIAATFCHPKDNMVRRVGAQKAIGLLQTACEGKDAHAMWIRPSDKNLKTILFNLGFTNALGMRFKSETNKIEWTRAQKAFKNVITDIQGQRIDAPKLKVAKARA